MNVAAEWRRNCCSSVTGRLCTALVVLQGSARPLETAITDKPDQVFFCFQGHKCIPCPEKWLQHGENCYHFSNEWKTWQESKAKCSVLESRLLKIESKEELVKIIFFSLSNYTLCILLVLNSHAILPLVQYVWHACAGPSGTMPLWSPSTCTVAAPSLAHLYWLQGS